MSENKPILTISLLSSGRIHTIERCLASLVPLKEQLKAEILVVDTDPDCREDVREILDRYADRVIRFDWIDDFAAARNVSIDEAKGIWYLFLDDDEWFIDTQPLVDFLQSDRTADFQWANIRIRNYHDDALQTYADTWVSRLFRLDYGTRFVGKVHELSEPVKGRPDNITALIGHTGYIFHNDEERLNHARRNMTLLEQLRKEQPREVRWVYQSLQEYNSTGETEKEMEASRTGYQLMDTARGYKNACIRGVFAANILRLEGAAKDWAVCYESYRRIVRERKPLGKVSKAFMERVAARAARELGLSKNSRKHCLRYLQAYEKLHDAPVEWAEDWLYFLEDTFLEKRVAYTAAMYVDLELADGNWEAIDAYFSLIRWEDGLPYDWRMLERQLLSEACALAYDPRFAVMVKTFWEKPGTQNALQNYLRELTNAGSESRFILESDAQGGKPLDLMIAWEDHEGRRENMVTHYRQLFSIANPLTLDPMLWEVGLRRGAVLDERIAEIPPDRWKACVDECMRDMTGDHIHRMAELMDEVYLGMPDEYCRYFQMKMNERLRTEEAAEQAALEREKQEQVTTATQAEMQQIIDALQQKVVDLIDAGLTDEAEKVLEEIKKYSPA